VLLEAMAAGTPVVASWIEGFADLIRDEQEGLLAAPRDSEALAAALKRMLSDDGMREEMGKAAGRTALAFSWERMSGQVLDFYEETLAARSGQWAVDSG
jgi:phosphatidylinositol alpha-mannosyltransferase